MDFNFPPPDSTSGLCDSEKSLEVIDPAQEVDVFAKGNSKFCGINSGNHFYLPIEEENQLISFVIRNRDGAVADWNIQITQVNIWEIL